jgi:electron transfer flavoprotein alpha subunit
MAGVISYSEDPELASELAVAGGEVAKILGTEAAVLELDEVSRGLRTRSRALLLAAVGKTKREDEGRMITTGGRTGRVVDYAPTTASSMKLEADADLAAAAIVTALRGTGFKVFLVGETRFGALLAAKTAARLKVCSLGRGKKLRIEGGVLVVDRDVYGGKFLATVAARRMPCVAMVQAGVYSQDEGAPFPTSIETIEVEPESSSRVETSDIVISAGRMENAGIKNASVVVSAGRGFAKKEDLSLARDLADALGAALGCSRPLSSDLGWMDEDAHVGLTGAYVHPKLYVAVGISGQLQHVAGIKDSRLIVAINKDRQAPIFQIADYGVVGDLYEILPRVTKLIREG